MVREKQLDVIPRGEGENISLGAVGDDVRVVDHILVGVTRRRSHARRFIIRDARRIHKFKPVKVRRPAVFHHLPIGAKKDRPKSGDEILRETKGDANIIILIQRCGNIRRNCGALI